MKKMLNSKKGYKTLITILALFFIVLTFVVFAFLFKWDKENASDLTGTSIAFKSIDTELALKTFLQSPSKATSSEIGYKIGDVATQADLLTRSCSNLQSTTFGKFRKETEDFFNRIYGDQWHLELIYYTPSGDDKITAGEVSTVSIGSTVRPFEIVKNTQSSAIAEEVTDMENMLSLDIAFLKLNIRDESLGSQILPCREGPAIVKLILIQWKEDAKWQ